MALFQRNGCPLQFNLIDLNSEERANLAHLIVQHGGEITDDEETLVKFTSQNACHRNEYPRAKIYSVQFIYDSVKAKKIVEPENYRCNRRIPGDEFLMLHFLGECGPERTQVCSSCARKIDVTITITDSSFSDEVEPRGPSVHLTEATEAYVSAMSMQQSCQSDESESVHGTLKSEHTNLFYCQPIDESQQVITNTVIENFPSLMGAGDVATANNTNEKRPCNVEYELEVKPKMSELAEQERQIVAARDRLGTIKNRQQATSPKARSRKKNCTVANGNASESGDTTEEAPCTLKKSNENDCTPSPDSDIIFVKRKPGVASQQSDLVNREIALSNNKSVPVTQGSNACPPLGLPKTSNNGNQDNDEQWITTKKYSPKKEDDNEKVGDLEKRLSCKDTITQNHDLQAGSSKVLNIAYKCLHERDVSKIPERKVKSPTSRSRRTHTEENHEVNKDKKTYKTKAVRRDYFGYQIHSSSMKEKSHKSRVDNDVDREHRKNDVIEKYVDPSHAEKRSEKTNTRKEIASKHKNRETENDDYIKKVKDKVSLEYSSSGKSSSPKKRRIGLLESENHIISVPSSPEVARRKETIRNCADEPGPSGLRPKGSTQYNSDSDTSDDEVIENTGTKKKESPHRKNVRKYSTFSSSSDDLDEDHQNPKPGSSQFRKLRHGTNKEWRDRLMADIPRPQGRKPFSSMERRKMLSYLIDNGRINSGKGLVIWKMMISDGFAEGRTPQSLQNHFIKHILPNIENARIEKEHLKAFLELRDGRK